MNHSIWQCPVCGVGIELTDPADAGVQLLLHFYYDGIIGAMTEPKALAQAILDLLDEQLVLHQGYATEARARGLSGLAAYYDTMSLGIVECIRAIRGNRIGDTSAWSQRSQQTDSPRLSGGPNDSTPSQP